MIKGCQRKMIMVRGGAEEIFELAYFVIRPERERPSRGEDGGDMVKEAIKIVSSYAPRTGRRRGSAIPEVIRFLLGMICGGGIAGLVCILLLGG